MAMKTICRSLILSLWLMLSSLAAADQNTLGQNVQITTNFRNVIGKPTWTLILRDANTGRVIPYIFDILNNDNYWIALSYGHSYKITLSRLKFGTYAVINNFCDLEDGILDGKSMILNLSGELSPNPRSSVCHVLKYNG